MSRGLGDVYKRQVPGIKRLGQRLERADRLRGKAADEKTRLRVDDPAMTSFAVIKHEPHLPFRYGSIIAGAVYNNTDSAVLSGICYVGDAEKPPVPAVFQGYGPSVIIGFQPPRLRPYQIEAQRSGFDLERRSSGVSALRFSQKIGASDIKLAPTWCRRPGSNRYGCYTVGF